MESRISFCLGQHSINITNFSSEEEVCHSVVVLVGIVRTNSKCSAERAVLVERIDGPWIVASMSSYNVSRDFRFKCPLKLEYGTNRFILKYCSTQQDFILHFKPRQTDFCVLPVYVVCRGHDGRFQAPEHEDNSVESACDRIDTGICLIQSLIAEKLKEAGFGRRTFQLQSDLDKSAPNCHVFYSQTTVEEAHASDMSTLWQWIGRELMNSPLGKRNYKFVAFLSSTLYRGELLTKQCPTYNDIIQCTRGHVALGGGGLALFGTGCLHTWAASVEEVVPRLLSMEKVDTTLFMDDSNYRGTYGGCFSTTLGAVCHEMGHVFDLGHTMHGIMGPDYHNLQIAFLQEEAETKSQSSLITEPSEESLLSSLQIAGAELDSKQSKDRGVNIHKQDGLIVPEQTTSSSEVLVRELIVSWKDPEIHHQSSTKISSMSPGSKNANYFQPIWDRNDKSTFWAKSCMSLLAYNRWINPHISQDQIDGLTFDTIGSHIKSTHSIRVVDVRDKNSKSILHWKFPEDTELTEFTIPKTYIVTEACSLCVIDSVGNVIKPELLQQ